MKVGDFASVLGPFKATAEARYRRHSQDVFSQLRHACDIFELPSIAMDTIRLEPITIKHAEAIQRLASDPLITDTTNMPSPYPHDGAAVWIGQLTDRMQAGEEYAYAIIEGETLVGVCGFVHVPENKELVEYGYWIGTPYWNRCYATAAGGLALEMAFDQLGFKSLLAPVLTRNAASARVLEKLGFRRTRIYNNTRYLKWEKTEMLADYELTRAEWMKSNTRSEG